MACLKLKSYSNKDGRHLSEPRRWGSGLRGRGRTQRPAHLRRAPTPGRLVQRGARTELRRAPSPASRGSGRLAHLLAASYIKLWPKAAEGIRDVYTGRAWATLPAGSGSGSETFLRTRASSFQLKTWFRTAELSGPGGGRHDQA